jgi:HAD superfamily hydrolase (TIGR01509 family)
LDSVKPFHKSHELLQRIKQKGKLLAAGSSAKKDELNYYLELLNAKELFDVTTSADDVNKSKPNPDIFEAALSKLQNSASETVVVGDSPYDAQAATRIGIPCVGVLCGGFAKQSLVDAGATAIYKGPEDLLDKLETSPLFK